MGKKETITLDQEDNTGRCIFIYSDPAVGKSFSALSLEDKLLIINTEKKSIK